MFDEKQQQAVSFNGHVWIEASAGSGKTRTIIGRLMWLCLRDQNPASMMILTFTQTASREILERFQKQWQEWCVLPPELWPETFYLWFPDEKLIAYEIMWRLGQDILNSIHPVICTIHQWSQSIIEKYTHQENYQSIVKPWHEKMIFKKMTQDFLASDQHKNIHLLYKIYTPYLVTNRFISLLEIGHHWRQDIENYRQSTFDPMQLRYPLDPVFMTEFDNCLQNIAQENQEIYQEFFAQWALKISYEITTDGYPLIESSEALHAWGMLMTQKNTPRKSLKHIAGDDKKIENILRKLQNLWYDDFLRWDFFYKEIFNDIWKNSMCDYFAKYQYYLKIHMLQDYDGIISSVLTLLNSQDIIDIAQLITHNIKHLMIDESQDNNPMQWMLIEKIAEYMLADTSGNYRTIMVVGDPKQSIYAFQGASVDDYLKFGKKLAGWAQTFEQPILKLSFQDSFRSNRDVINFINKTFIKDIDMGVPFSEHYISCFKIDKDPQVLSQKISIKKTDDKDTECKKIVNHILNIVELNEGMDLSHIMILVRARNWILNGLCRYLNESGVSYSMPAYRVLGEVALLQRWAALFRWMLDENDQWAFLLLYDVFGGDVASFRHKDEDVMQKLKDMRQCLMRHGGIKQWIIFLDMDMYCDDLWSFLVPVNDLELSLLIQWKELLENQLDLPYKIHMRWWSLWGNESIKVAEKRVQNSIRIHTIHQAKGAEAPYVFYVTDANERHRSPEWIVAKNGFVLWGMATEEEKEAYKNNITQENNRLHYVALSRAMNSVWWYEFD